tara:strand:+ start:264439 stop:264828 length:390 start_codon:yes stop_codon:yes gene_type:complete
MKANILRDALGNITVQMEGDLGFEHSIPFKEELQQLVQENPHSKITIDLGGIDFVGSSGICHFVETVETMNKDHAKRIGLSNVSKEFKKIFRLFSFAEADLVWDELGIDDEASENLNTAFGNRKRTFEQ